MPVIVNRVGQSGNARVEVTVDVADLLAAGLTGPRLRSEAVTRAVDELQRSRQAADHTDQQIDAAAAEEVARVQSQAAAKKAARPTGNL